MSDSRFMFPRNQPAVYFKWCPKRKEHITQLGMVPRLDSLDGKTVYLVDVRFDDGDILLQQMQAWFSEYMPKVNTVFVRKTGVYTQDDATLFQEIKEKADAVILGVGH